MLHFITNFKTLFFLFLAASICLSAEDWKLEKVQEGVSVHTQKVKGSGYLRFKGEVVVESDVDTLVALMYDTPNAVEWIYNCDQSMTLAQVSFESNFILQVYDFPFPVSDRQVLLHSQLSYTPTGALLTTEEANNFCTGKTTSKCLEVLDFEFVKMPISKGSYEFIRLQKHQTKVIWTQHTDPGGSISEWLVNLMVVDTPYETLLALKDEVKKEQYKNITAKELKLMWNKNAHLLGR